MIKTQSIALASAIVLILPLPIPLSGQALSATYDFTVGVTEGPLTGQQFDGTFCFSNDAIQGQGTEVLRVADGLSVSMTFFGNEYTATDDTDYPEFPTLTLEDGEVLQLDFWIEEGDRLVWWDLPHWQVSLTQQTEDTVCLMPTPNVETRFGY